MAGDWIKMRASLRTHPKIVRISSAMKADGRPDKLRVIGALQVVWSLFDEHSVDGVLPGYTFESMDEELNWVGFSAAMGGVDWLDEGPGVGLTMPDFSTHNGASAKRRAQDAERKRLERESTHKPSDIRPKNVQTRRGLEKRREERNLKHPQEQAASTIETSRAGENPRAAGLKAICSRHRVSLNAKGVLHIAQWIAEGVTDEQLEQAVAIARERKPDPQLIPIAYLAPIVSDVREGRIVPQVLDQEAEIAKFHQHQLERDLAEHPGWWHDQAQILERGNLEQVMPVRNEAWEHYQARVFAAAGEGPWRNEASPEIQQLIEHYLARGINPVPPTKAHPVPVSGAR